MSADALIEGINVVPRSGEFEAPVVLEWMAGAFVSLAQRWSAIDL